MGIVIRQSFRNLLSTYTGFGIGAINTLFLYTYFFTEAYYGLVSYILSTATLMMPLLAFGVQNTTVKFFSGYTDADELKKFTGLMLLLPALVALPVSLIGFLAHQQIAAFLSVKNPEAGNYLGSIFLIGFAMAYFEVFFAWAKVHLRTVYGNFLKEVFPRLLVMAMLIGVYLGWLHADLFIPCLVGVYLLRMLLMAADVAWFDKPSLALGLPTDHRKILRYTLLIIIAGSIGVVFLDIDKFMLNRYMGIENIAYYSVAVYIAVVIAVPTRALHQITYPLTSRLMNQGNMKELALLYKKSAVNLMLVGGLIFLLIVLNTDQLYTLLHENYREGITVVYIIAVAKLSDNLLGNNNAILFNSDHYRMVLIFGLLLSGLIVILNMIFIPLYGINGAAFATLLAFLSYNALKIWYVWKKMHLFPLNWNILKLTGVLLVFIGVFGFWDFNFHPIVNIALKSSLLTIAYLWVCYRLSLSAEVNAILYKALQKIWGAR